MSLIVEVGQGYACVLELNKATGKLKFLKQRREANQCDSGSILHTDSIAKMRVGLACLSPLSLYKRWEKFSDV